MKPHIAALQRAMLHIVRDAGTAGISAEDVKVAAALHDSQLSQATLDHTFSTMIRSGLITGKGVTRRRLYVATVLATEAEAAQARSDRAEIYAMRPLKSWPPRQQPRPNPPWMNRP